MDNITVREAKIEDLESILTLSDELTLSDLPYDKEVNIEWAHTDKGIDYYTEKINRKIGICFVAEYDKKIVGYATAGIKDIPSYRLIKVVELENLVVDKDVRSRGIGKALISKFKQWAKEMGANRVCVNVFSLNEKAISFYKREGFIPYETILEMQIESNQ